MNKNPMLVTAIVAVLVAVVAFFGGMQYQKMQRGAQFAGNRQLGQNGAPGGNRAGAAGRNGTGRPVTGQILSSDDKSITVKLPDGSSKIVLLGSSVAINKTDPGSKTDLKVGTTVGVFGTDNSDGTVTAQNIQLNPTFGMRNASSSALPK